MNLSRTLIDRLLVTWQWLNPNVAQLRNCLPPAGIPTCIALITKHVVTVITGPLTNNYFCSPEGRKKCLFPSGPVTNNIMTGKRKIKNLSLFNVSPDVWEKGRLLSKIVVRFNKLKLFIYFFYFFSFKERLSLLNIS